MPPNLLLDTKNVDRQGLYTFFVDKSGGVVNLPGQLQSRHVFTEDQRNFTTEHREAKKAVLFLCALGDLCGSKFCFLVDHETLQFSAALYDSANSA